MAAQIFISYAPADNKPYEEGAKGWVSNFVEKLLNAIGMKEGGSGVECWMDHRLEPQRAVDDELFKRIKESTCILAFLSPRYLKSEWCQREMDTFVRLVGGGSANNRVFLIELLPTQRNDWHSGIKSITPIELWHKSFDQPEPMLLGWPVPDLKLDKVYWQKLNYVASILPRQMQELSAIPTAPASPVPVSPSPVMPAENPSTPAQMSQSGPISVVINADKPDRDLGKHIRNLLDELDVDAVLSAEPLPTQPPAEYRGHLATQLEDSHGVLIVYGSAPPSWVQVQHSWVRKVLATQRKGVWGALVNGPPEVKPELDLGSRSNLLILDCRKEGPSQELLKDFVQKLREADHV